MDYEFNISAFFSEKITVTVAVSMTKMESKDKEKEKKKKEEKDYCRPFSEIPISKK